MLGRLVDYKTSRPIGVDLKTWKIYHVDTPEDRGPGPRSRQRLPDALSQLDGSVQAVRAFLEIRLRRVGKDAWPCPMDDDGQGNEPQPRGGSRCRLAGTTAEE